MSKLLDGDDGLPAEDIGQWAKEKHRLLCAYVDICRATRRKFLPPNKGGSTYIDLFCGTGRARIRETGEWVDGSAVAAWKASVRSGTPFTRVIIADADPIRLDASRARLERLDAPVVAICGTAQETAFKARQKAAPYGLNFAFLDPYNLQALHFEAVQQLARISRIDMLIHVSTMDLQRNTERYASIDESAFDAFAPGWREHVPLERSLPVIRNGVLSYWRSLVEQAGVWTSDDIRLITGSRNERLYWLVLAARHELAHQFWTKIVDTGQRSLDL